MYSGKKQEFSEVLLKNIKDNLPKLEELQEKIGESDDEIYRFYHYSFKVYYIQNRTKQIVELLKNLAPKGLAEAVQEECLKCKCPVRVFNSFFEQIYQEGTGKEFEREHNQDWLKQDRKSVV